MNGQHCYITPITLKTASIVLPTINNFHWTKFLTSSGSVDQNLTIESFVDNLLDDQLTGTLEESSVIAPEPAHHSWTNLNTLKGNYVDKKVSHFGTHWKMLQHW